MAHIGQQWRLAFRRDLGQSITGGNRFGFPEQMQFLPGTALFPFPWFPGQPVPWYSNGPTYGVSPMATWTWPTFSSGGKIVGLKFVATKPRTPADDVYALYIITVDGVERFRREDHTIFPNGWGSWGDRFSIFTTVNTLAAVGLDGTLLGCWRARFWSG